MNTLISTLGNFRLLTSYIDGGTGSMLLQAALAGVLGGLYVLKTRFAQFRSLWGKVGKRKESDPQE